MIREFRQSDVEKIRQIHENHFKEEFEFPDFLKNFLCAFIVEDDDGGIVAAGGVRTLAELIAVTNKERTPRERRKGLYELLAASIYVSEKTGHDSLHAFIQDPLWLHQMKRRGFAETKGKSLYIGV